MSVVRPSIRLGSQGNKQGAYASTSGVRPQLFPTRPSRDPRSEGTPKARPSPLLCRLSRLRSAALRRAAGMTA